MKINTSNPYSILTDSGQVLGDLNLKEGQKIIGKIIRFEADQALLEMAGRPLTAKVEGAQTLTPGSVYTFQVATDDQNRILLKIVNNQTGMEPETSLQPSAMQSANGTQPELAVEKAIISALENSGLPVTNENIATVFGSLQEFKAKYQQALPPQVITFIISQKWPINPATILTAWIYQDPGIRDLIWNQLQKNALEKIGANGNPADAIVKWVLDPHVDTETTLAAKLQSYSGRQLTGILERLFGLDQAFSDTLRQNPDLQTLARSGRGFPSGMADQTDSRGQADVANSPKNLAQSPPHHGSGVSSGSTHFRSISDDPAALRLTKNDPFQQTGIANPADAIQKDTASKGDNPPEKFLALLEQNQKLQNALHQEPGVYNAIPFLVRNPQNQLHEAVIQWEERKSERSPNCYEQLIQLAVPTDNMGEILLQVRIAVNSTNIHMKVGSEAVRKFFMQNASELRTAISAADAVIQVSLRETESSRHPTMGVDLWM